MSGTGGFHDPDVNTRWHGPEGGDEKDEGGDKRRDVGVSGKSRGLCRTRKTGVQKSHTGGNVD